MRLPQINADISRPHAILETIRPQQGGKVIGYTCNTKDSSPLLVIGSQIDVCIRNPVKFTSLGEKRKQVSTNNN